MNNLPLVSVITPSYNQTAFLESCMRSVLAQSYPHLEYFVVDGGSTDGSVQLIQRLAQEYSPRLAWWVSLPDQGQADAINKGMRRASGDIIAWLNSDDVYLPDALHKAVSVFKADPKLGLLYSHVLSINGQDEIINLMRFKPYDLKNLMAFRIIGQPGVFMRRSALVDAGYLDTDYHMLLDHHLWLRIAASHRVRLLDDFLAAARFHPQAKNLAHGEQFSREAFQLLEWMENSAELSETCRAYRRQIRAGAYSFSARYLMDAGFKGKAVLHYFACLLQHPPTALRAAYRFIYALANLVMPLGWVKNKFLEIKKSKAVYNGEMVLKKWWLHGES